MTPARVLVVDDEPGLREMLAILFRREGLDVSLAPGFAAARDAVLHAPEPYAVVLTDLLMPDGNGMDLLTLVKQRTARTEVIVMTAHGGVETAIEAMKRGAYDFVTKPFAASELRALVQKALEKRAIVAENERLRAQLVREKGREILGHSEAMRRIFDLVQRVANARTTVLVTGESGTGKERVARAIHEASDRRDRPFLVINCGAIPEALIEAELFGHERGAFTGAVTSRGGMFREAEGGTLLLDEVGELASALQVKLLRVLQERKVRAVGATGEVSVDVRVLAATNRPVEEDVRIGRFRQDLYYRLNVIRIEVPPLRERREDIRPLAEHFLARCGAEQSKDIRALSPDAVRALEGYAFPGNVRELENVIERAVALATGPTIGLGDLPRELSGAAAQPTPALVELAQDGCNLDDVLGEVERRLLLQALERSDGVRTHAAKLLGVTLRSLRYRLQKHALGDAGEGPDEGSSDIDAPESAGDPPRNVGT
ncbi:MAG TPA: sigma-54 dependent transcriptional regulator [Polyangiaceae bacterium]|nr:sigma-54 dependent transcriptional regulator [Polyangiaceae bacterium]